MTLDHVYTLTDGLWDHQRRQVVENGLQSSWLYLWEPRVGKSLPVLREAQLWHAERGVRRIVLCAPQTVCEVVWAPLVRAEAAKMARDYPGTILNRPEGPVFDHSANAPQPWQALDLYSGSLAQRSQRLRTTRASADWLVAIVSRDTLAPLVEDLIRWVKGAPTGIIFDELHDYKSPSSARARAAFRIARTPTVQFRRGLTGTPVSEGYEDAYGQYKVVAPRIFGTNKSEFLEKYVTFDPHAHYPKILGYRNVDDLQNKMLSVASVINREDCFDVPQVLDIEREFDLPPAAQAAYDTIVNDHVLELSGGIEIPVRHTFARLAQLRQICIGYARYLEPKHGDDERGADDKTIRWLHDQTMNVVAAEVADLMEAGQKVVLFHAFNPERDRLMQVLKEYRPLSISGKTPGDARARFLDAFDKDPDYPILIAQENVAALGVSMKSAHYAGFVSFGLSRATHKQARDRIFKPAGEMEPGRTLTVMYPLARGTVVQSMLAMQRTKRDAEALLLGGDRINSFVALARGTVKP